MWEVQHSPEPNFKRIQKETKNRNETGSHLSLGTCFMVLSKRLGRKCCCGTTPDRCLDCKKILRLLLNIEGFGGIQGPEPYQIKIEYTQRRCLRRIMRKRQRYVVCIHFLIWYASGPEIPPKPSIFGRRRSIFFTMRSKDSETTHLQAAVRCCVTTTLASETFWQHRHTCT